MRHTIAFLSMFYLQNIREIATMLLTITVEHTRRGSRSLPEYHKCSQVLYASGLYTNQTFKDPWYLQIILSDTRKSTGILYRPLYGSVPCEQSPQICQYRTWNPVQRSPVGCCRVRDTQYLTCGT